MAFWLLLDVELQFANQYRSIRPRDYRPDVVTEDDLVTYYGMHFISAPAEINPGDRITGRIMLRAFPEIPCLLFQPDKKIFVKEGPIIRAEGIITGRLVYESSANTILQLQDEIFKVT